MLLLVTGASLAHECFPNVEGGGREYSMFCSSSCEAEGETIASKICFRPFPCGLGFLQFAGKQRSTRLSLRRWNDHKLRRA